MLHVLAQWLFKSKRFAGTVKLLEIPSDQITLPRIRERSNIQTHVIKNIVNETKP
jgi:hypothetical protein